MMIINCFDERILLDRAYHGDSDEPHMFLVIQIRRYTRSVTETRVIVEKVHVL